MGWPTLFIKLLAWLEGIVFERLYLADTQTVCILKQREQVPRSEMTMSEDTMLFRLLYIFMNNPA